MTDPQLGAAIAAITNGPSLTQMAHRSLHTPIGDLTIFEEDGAIVALETGWVDGGGESIALHRTVAALDAYFDGTALPDDLPLAPAGTAYQQRVWTALLGIPHGSTVGYAAIARIAGGAPRSVGQALGRNPIPILIPCHRVTAAAGLGGYSFADGAETKEFLLSLEQVAP